MQINKQALNRVATARMTGEGIAEILNLLLIKSEMAGVPPSFVLDYQEPDDTIEEGDLIPVITVSLRPVIQVEDDNMDRLDSESADYPELVENRD